MMDTSGRHFLQIPGPTNVPDRILRAMAQPTIDHRGGAFALMTLEILEGLKMLFKTSGPVLIYPSSGTGAGEAALVNALSPADTVLMFETGHFATMWRDMGMRLGLKVDFVPGDWRRGVDPALVEAKLTEDVSHGIKAVMVVHNETSSGVTSRIPAIRDAIDRARHPALLIVDTISSLASTDFRMDEWGVDVAIGCSQKGLMLPPGLGLNAVSEKALAAAKTARLKRCYWDWEDMLAANQNGFFTYTPITNLLYGLSEAIRMLLEEGLDHVFARHRRHAEAARRAVHAWGLELVCAHAAEYSSSLTAVTIPPENDADDLRELILKRFNMSLGAGLGRLAGRVFRIGHLGDFNDLMLAGTLSGVEMGLALAGIPFRAGGVSAALAYLTTETTEAPEGVARSPNGATRTF